MKAIRDSKAIFCDSQHSKSEKNRIILHLLILNHFAIQTPWSRNFCDFCFSYSLEVLVWVNFQTSKVCIVCLGTNINHAYTKSTFVFVAHVTVPGDYNCAHSLIQTKHCLLIRGYKCAEIRRGVLRVLGNFLRECTARKLRGSTFLCFTFITFLSQNFVMGYEPRDTKP